MDFLSPIGLFVALFAIGLGQYLEGGEIGVLVNPPALLIVLGGTIGAVMLQTRFDIFKQSIFLMRWVLQPPEFPMQESITKFSKWARIIRKSGLVGLESNILSTDPFCKVGLNALFQGMNGKQIRQILEVELLRREQARLAAANVFSSMGGYAPTIGIIGAVLGLIEVMGHLNEPAEIGAGIAVAFVATIYGVALANLLFIPIANKIKAHIQQESNYHELIMEGVISLAMGDSSKFIESKLTSHLNA